MGERQRQLESELRELVRTRLAHILADHRATGSTAPAESMARRLDRGGPDLDDWEDIDPDQPAADRGAVDGYPDADARSDASHARRDPGPRVGFNRVHLGVVVVLLLVGLLAAGWGVLRARPVALATPIGQTAPTSSAAESAGQQPNSPTPAHATPTASSSQRPIMVYVLGAVRDPGVVSLPPPARVQDAVEAAGGLSRNADPAQLNLAQVLADGQQVMIGTTAEPVGQVRQGGGPGEPGASGATTRAESDTVLDLNTASADELDTLPGVGPVTATKIITWRDEHGRFTRVEELQEIDGIGPKTFAELASQVRV